MAADVMGPGWRQCQITGLRVDRNAERLVMFHAVTAVLYLAAGGVMALLLALTRWEAVHLLDDAEWFYRVISAHGAAMLIFWILFFEVAGLIFGSTILLNQPMVAPRVGWVTYGMMVAGSLGALLMMLSGRATVMFTAYPPLQASSWFYLSVLVFAVGALINVVLFIVNIVGARLRGQIQSLPLFSYALLAAAIIALWTLVSGAVAIFPLWLWSLDVIDGVDPGAYRLLFWGFGHGAQQVNLAAMVGVWYGLASITTGARAINEGLSRFAFVLYIFFINMGAMHHLLVDPGLGDWARGFNASYFIYLAVLGSMIHAFTIPASVEMAQRLKGHSRGLLGWLRNAPWGEPGFAALAISFAAFGILGGISGVIMGGVQMSLISHNTLIVPAHFHMTVVLGTTVAFMGFSYYVIPLVFRRELISRRLAQIQPYFYGGGMLLFTLGMMSAGQQGVPRRHFDIEFETFAGTSQAVDVFDKAPIDAALAVMGIGAVLAVIGGAIYVIVAAGSVFLGRRTDTPYVGNIDPTAFSPAMPTLPAVSGASVDEPAHDHDRFEAPGTLLLASIWLALFVVLYGISWLNLSRVVWEIR
jgi:cytochrome c oxidase subunit 1